MLGLLVLAVAPSVALFLFFYSRDRYNKEPLGILLVTFGLGAVVLVPAVVTSSSLERLTGWHSNTPNLLHAFIGAMLIVGLVEEGAKFIVVRFYAYHRPEFDEPYDGIMYSVMAALGFATAENLLYVLTGGAGTGVLRALLSVPSHAFDGVLMGYFLGEAKFARSDRQGNWLTALGLGLAVFAHGLYDFIVFSLDKAPLMFISLIVLAILSWVIFFKATRKLSDQSPFRRISLTELHRSSAEEARAAKENPPVNGEAKDEGRVTKDQGPGTRN
jgi:RsiW-degrading membrane proteinase PrsW (M82 family)